MSKAGEKWRSTHGSWEKFLMALVNPYWTYGALETGLQKAGNWISEQVSDSDSGSNRFLKWLGISQEDFRSLIDRFTGASLTGAQREEMEWNEQQAAITRQREDTQYQRTVADMKAAGVNPALAMTNGASVSPSSAQAQGSVNSGANGMSMSDLIQLIRLPMEMRQMSRMTDADIAMKNAQTGLTVAETGKVQREAEGIANQNEWFVNSRDYERNFLALRNEGQRLANALSTETKNKIIAEVDEIRSRITLFERQAETEVAKRAAEEANAALARANAEQLAALRPYQQALMRAQADLATKQGTAAEEEAIEIAERANLAYWQAQYQEGLVNSDYLTAMVGLIWEQKHEACVRAGLASEQALALHLRNMLRDKHQNGDGLVPGDLEWLYTLTDAIGFNVGASVGAHN